jgi:hypothetical protein
MLASRLWQLIAIETDRKSLLALQGVRRESEAERVRFHGRRVTKESPEVKLPPEG